MVDSIQKPQAADTLGKATPGLAVTGGKKSIDLCEVCPSPNTNSTTKRKTPGQVSLGPETPRSSAQVSPEPGTKDPGETKKSQVGKQSCSHQVLRHRKEPRVHPPWPGHQWRALHRVTLNSGLCGLCRQSGHTCSPGPSCQSS